MNKANSSKKVSLQLQPDTCTSADTELMILDEQTFKDLEVFDTPVGGTSLFDLCNHTRSRSGGQALRERMRRPWSNPDRIISVQKSIAFIIANRQLFDPLPSYVTTQIVDKYFHSTLTPIHSENIVDFGIGLVDLLLTDSRCFDMITQGVGVTIETFQTLRQILQSTQQATLQDCELADIMDEMRDLLDEPRITNILTQSNWGFGPWIILRNDQVLRNHEKATADRLLKLIYEIDALLSLAETTRIQGFVMPGIAEGPLSVHAEGVTHPLVEDAVANPVELSQNRRLLFLTGPNMAGKTTYLRSFAIALYFAHLGMGVPARSFSFVPAQKLFTSITLSDNLHSGVSYFRAEGLRVKAIAQAVADGYRVIALMDEPFKGTNVKDAIDASSAILLRFSNKQNNLFMFSSHLIELCDQLQNNDQVDCRFFEAREDAGKLSFEYVLRDGVSSQRLGMRVLQEEGIFELLDGGASALHS